MDRIDWEWPKRIEQDYLKSLRKIIRLIFQGLTGDFSLWPDFLNSIIRSAEFNRLAENAARRFVTQANLDVGRTWREAARASGKGRLIYEALREELQGNVGQAVNARVTENASLIKTLPLDIAQKISAKITEMAYAGLRPEEIAERLKKETAQYTRAKIRLIARTESSKAMTALTEARAKDVGLNWYIWRTAEDGRVRSSHRHMDGVLVNWNAPPAPEELISEKSAGHYHAGNIYNCRCIPIPLFGPDDVRWPHKVYHGGRIENMTRTKFIKIM